MNKLVPTLAACTAIAASSANAATIVELDSSSTGFQAIAVAADGDDVTGVDGARPGPYWVRSRSNTSQTDRYYRSFIQYDVSSLTPADVNDPGFSATFSVTQNYGSSSAEIAILVGANDGGAWNTTTSTPEYAWGAASEDVVTLVENTDPFIAGTLGVAADEVSVTHTVDVTTIVQNWVNGVYDNEGFAVFEGVAPTKTSSNQNNIWSFEDPTLTLNIVPEPGSLALMALGGLCVMRRRRS